MGEGMGGMKGAGEGGEGQGWGDQGSGPNLGQGV